jgi:cell wall-associated NlpC family hydrolase
MSIQDVQARTAEISARLQALSGGTPLGGGPISATPADTSSFADSLSKAQSTLPTAASTVATADLGKTAVGLAEQQIGTPYVFGGSKPGGFDCSGLVQWTYQQLGVSLPRTSAEQGKAGTPVSPADAQPGDLVYFDHKGPVDHIGIYLGNGKWVVAPHTGAKVRIEDVDLSKATSIRRVTGASAPISTAAGSWASKLPPAGQKYASLIQKAADATGVDPRLLASVGWTESDFNPRSSSTAGAQGVMQLMPQTAAGLGVDPLDPGQAFLGGARYLKTQLDAFGGRADLALAAYNAGPGAVRKAGGIPPYAETQAYVTKVLGHFSALGGIA